MAPSQTRMQMRAQEFISNCLASIDAAHFYGGLEAMNTALVRRFSRTWSFRENSAIQMQEYSHWQSLMDPPARRLQKFSYLLNSEGGTRWRSWFRHCAAGLKVSGSISGEVVGIFH